MKRPKLEDYIKDAEYYYKERAKNLSRYIDDLHKYIDHLESDSEEPSSVPKYSGRTDRYGKIMSLGELDQINCNLCKFRDLSWNVDDICNYCYRNNKWNEYYLTE